MLYRRNLQHMYIYIYRLNNFICCIHIYIYTYIHTYIHTYTHTHTHTYMHTYIHTYKHTHTYIHTLFQHVTLFHKRTHDVCSQVVRIHVLFGNCYRATQECTFRKSTRIPTPCRQIQPNCQTSQQSSILQNL